MHPLTSAEVAAARTADMRRRAEAAQRAAGVRRTRPHNDNNNDYDNHNHNLSKIANLLRSRRFGRRERRLGEVGDCA